MFGGLPALPLRLTGNPETGWSANQHARFCADLIAARRTAPFARLTISRDASGVITLEDWICLAPHVDENKPTISGTNPTPITITFPKAPKDHQGNAHTLSIKSVHSSRWDSSDPAKSGVSAPHIATSDPSTASASKVTVTVYADWNEPHGIEDYGGDLEKEDCTTEVIPYAWIWYQELGASLGSAFGSQMSGRVHGRKLALARALAGLSRAEERKRLQSTPHTAQGGFQQEWADVMQIPFPQGLPESSLRNRTSTHFAAQSGQDVLEIEAACSDLLGSMFVDVTTFDVADPDGNWPSSYDLGPGVWASTRGKLIVNIDAPAAKFDPEFTNLVNVQLMQMLDVLTPSWVVYDWADPGGFYLGESLLDYDAL